MQETLSLKTSLLCGSRFAKQSGIKPLTHRMAMQSVLPQYVKTGKFRSRRSTRMVENDKVEKCHQH